MSWLEKQTWKPLTPASVPAGARIYAGNAGSVLMSLPNIAYTFVNCVPANCIPSPESPAKRITTDSCSCTGFAAGFVGAFCSAVCVTMTSFSLLAPGSSRPASGPFSLLLNRLGNRRQLIHGGRKMLRQMMHQVRHRDASHDVAVVVHHRQPPQSTLVHQVDQGRHAVGQPDRLRIAAHTLKDRRLAVEMFVEHPPHIVLLGEYPEQLPFLANQHTSAPLLLHQRHRFANRRRRADPQARPRPELGHGFVPEMGLDVFRHGGSPRLFSR